MFFALCTSMEMMTYFSAGRSSPHKHDDITQDWKQYYFPLVYIVNINIGLAPNSTYVIKSTNYNVDIFKAVAAKSSSVFWDIIPCSLVETN
jgi:hypothetical protein